MRGFGGVVHDLADGLHLSDSYSAAQGYGDLRGKGSGYVVGARLDRRLLGRVLDLSGDPRWAKFLSEKFPVQLFADTWGEYASKSSKFYQATLQSFLRQHGIDLSLYDSIIAADLIRNPGTRQLCIMNEKIAAHIDDLLQRVESPVHVAKPQSGAGSAGGRPPTAAVEPKARAPSASSARAGEPRPPSPGSKVGPAAPRGLSLKAGAALEVVLFAGLIGLDYYLKGRAAKEWQKINEDLMRLFWELKIVPKVNRYLDQSVAYLDLYREQDPDSVYYLNIEVLLIYRVFDDDPPKFRVMRMRTMGVSKEFRESSRLLHYGGDFEHAYVYETSVAVVGPGIPDPVRTRRRRRPVAVGGSGTRVPIQTGGSAGARVPIASGGSGT